MRVVMDKKDRYGRYPIWFSSCNLSDIHDWLWENYQGYKFAIIIDTMVDEYAPIEKPVPVYFLDEVEKEVKHYKGE